MKKVLIGVLAALMLFAFTACEPTVPQIPHDVTVLGATIKSGSLYYYEGDDFDSTRYTVEVIWSDTTTKEISGAGVLSTSGAVRGATDVTLQFAGESMVIGKVYGVEADSITLDTSKAKTSYVNTTVDGAITDANLVVTATYGDNQTKVLDSDQYTATLKKASDNKSGVVTVVAGEAKATYDVTLTDPAEEPKEPTELTDNKTVTRIEAEFIGNEGSLEFYRTVSDIATVVTTPANWKVTGYDEDGNYYVYKNPTVTAVASMQNVGKYKVQVSAPGKDNKTLTSELFEVTVKDAPVYAGLRNGSVYVIPSGDYELTDENEAEIAKMVYGQMADYSMVQDFKLETITKNFFPADLTADQTVNITVSWTVDSSVVLNVTDAITIRRGN